MTIDAIRRCGQIARHQRGLITHEQAIDAGISRQAIERRAREGVWNRIQPRVYLLEGVPPDPRTALLAAILSAGGQAVVSMQTAASLHGLQRVGRLDPVHITLPQTFKDEVWNATVHRTRRLEPIDTAEIDGLPCTSVARTLIDLAAVLDRTALTALVDDAMGSSAVTRRLLHQRATALRNGRTGVGNLLLLTSDDAEARFRSWLERRAAHVLSTGGVPAPKWNEPIRAEGRLIGLADACWREKHLIAEFDGVRFHSGSDKHRADATRERELVLAGWRVLRFTYLDVEQSPEQVVAALHRALT